MAIKKIMCCCGSGIGSSLMLRMNVEKVLKQMGKTGIEVTHSTTSDAQAGAAALFCVGADLEEFVSSKGEYIALKNIMSAVELRAALEEKFAKLG